MTERITTKQLAHKVSNVNTVIGFDAFSIGGAYGHTHVEDFEGRDHVHGTKREAWDWLNAVAIGRQMTQESERRASQGYTNYETLHFSMIVDNDSVLYNKVTALSQGDIIEAEAALSAWFQTIREAVSIGANPQITAGKTDGRTIRELAMVGAPHRINWREVVGHHSNREYLR